MKRKVDVLFLIVSIIIGIFLGVAGETLYRNAIFGFESRIMTITVYLFVFAFIMGIILLFKGLRNSTFVNFGKVMLFTLIATVAFVGCSALFEFLYELGGDKIQQNQATELQYVFLIDDSGSMTQNDPYNERYDAVESIIRGLNSTDKFAVYAFANDTVCITPIGSENPRMYDFRNSVTPSGGGTYLMQGVEDVIKEVGHQPNVHTKIIVLTDGIPQDAIFYNKVIRKCIREGASVSSIGFGQPDESFLERLAKDTGGMYVFSDNISSLTTDLNTIVNAQTLPLAKNRDLLGYRNDATYDSFWYGFLRVFFLILLGLLWSVIKLLLVGERKFMQSSAILSVVLCSVAAILVEIVLFAFDFAILDTPVRVLFCAMWACTLIPKDIYEKTNLGDSLHSAQGNQNKGDLMNDFNTRSREVGGPKSFL